MIKNKVNDMTAGRPGKLLLRFALPLMLGNIFQQLYTFFDTIIIGRKLGVNGLAAVGNCEWMIFLLFGAIQGITQGLVIKMGQAFGAKEEKHLRKLLFHALVICALVALLFTIGGMLAYRIILKWIHTPEEIIPLSEEYLSVLYGFAFVSVCYNLAASILRVLGNSRTPLIAMTVSSIINIVLDLIFVFVFNFGITGAAAATVIAQAVAFLLCFFPLTRMHLLRMQKDEIRIEKRIFMEELKMSLPMGLQNAITAIGGVFVQSAINGFGIIFIAGFTAANKLYGLLEIAASSYGYAVVTYTSQNVGAGKIDRVKKGIKSASLIGIVTAYMMSMIMILFGKRILLSFLTGEAQTIAEMVAIGYRFLLILAVFFPLLYLLYIIRSCVQGLGNAILPMVSSGVQLAMRLGCAFLLTRLMGQDGVFWGEIFAWIGADILLFFSYCYGISRLEKNNRN